MDKNKKETYYKELSEQVKALVSIKDPIHTNLGNISAAIKYKFNWFWVGFYKVEKQELILHAFQGPTACTRIGWKKGVCGKSWHEKKPIIVNDVSLFEGHIACNSASKSEIVFPIIDKDGNVKFILDIDHSEINAFSKNDIIWMQPILETISTLI
tara:strand:+ start:5549 stop:6013 length:465 start_codon:yes stop_codon:yes gene_type:complete